jgi:hypothetical protein
MKLDLKQFERNQEEAVFNVKSTHYANASKLKAIVLN